MSTELRAAAERLIGYIESNNLVGDGVLHDLAQDLRGSLAQPEEKPEPVAWYLPSADGDDSLFRDHSTVVACTGNTWEGWIPLYTHPADASQIAERARAEEREACVQALDLERRKWEAFHDSSGSEYDAGGYRATLSCIDAIRARGQSSEAGRAD